MTLQNSRLKMPAPLAEMSFSRETLSDIAESAIKDHSSVTNPRPASTSDYLAILEAAYEDPAMIPIST